MRRNDASMLSKTKHSIAVAAAILAATSPVALAASGDPGAGPSQSAPRSAQAATSGGGTGVRAYRHCYRVVYGGSVRWRCVWR
jgi:hypothetical protein